VPPPALPSFPTRLSSDLWVQTSVYDLPLVDFRFQAVLTNTAPTGAYRGAGRPEAIFTMERLLDEAARQAGIDRVQLRRRNFIRRSEEHTSELQSRGHLVC